MNHDAAIERIFVELSAALDNDPGEGPLLAPLTPEADQRLAAQFEKMVARTGEIEGIRCFIEPTEWDTFQLRGFNPGRWRVTAWRLDWDGETDAIQHDKKLVFELDDMSPPGAEPWESVHEIRGLNDPAEADDFFNPALRLRWEAERILEDTQAVS